MSDQGYEPTRVDQPAVTPPEADVTPPGGVPVPPPGEAEGPPPPGGPPTGEPPAEPPDRRPWIIGGLVAAVVAVIIILLLLGGDDDDDDVATDASTTTSSTTTAPSSTTTSTSTTALATTTIAAPATTTTAGPTTTTEPGPVTVDPDICASNGADPENPAIAAVTVFDAWTRGDEACAAPLMTDEARGELFARDGTGARDEFQQCSEQEQNDEPYMDCAFTYEGGSTHYLMTYTEDDGWKVFDILQIAD